MLLIQVETGKRVRVMAFSGGRNLESKLRQLGVTPGDTARVVRLAPFGGPVLIEISGREIALGRGVAARIEVEEYECASP